VEKLNNHKESHSFKGNWWNNGVGINANINQKHTIYLDLESSPGNKFDLLQVNGGYRYSF
jgi:outer membrane autotransporter barrel domain